MSDGAQVRTLDDLKEHFDIEKVVGYFTDGRLLNWLQSRYYDEEADKVEQLTANDPQLQQKLCAIFGVESTQDIDPEEIAHMHERLNKLKQYTYDKEILDNVDIVAFDQEDLSDLLDEYKPLIYLCNNKFVIPLRETHKIYIGVGKAVAVIRSNKLVDFDELNINFKSMRFDDNYDALFKAQQSNDDNAADERGDFKTAMKKYKKATELNPNEKHFWYHLGQMYRLGRGTNKNLYEAFNFYTKAVKIDDNNIYALKNLADCYRYGDGTAEDSHKAFEL